MPTIAPKALSGRVREFCRTVNADSEPVFVPVVPAEDALARECFPNVARLVEERGGALVYGWAVWMWPNVYIEAEHHAVWRAPGGALLDPTPTPHGEDRILSVPDPAADYDFAGNRLRDNIRWPLTSDPAVADFLAAAAAWSALVERHTEGDGRLVSLPVDEARSTHLRRQRALERLLDKRRLIRRLRCGQVATLGWRRLEADAGRRCHRVARRPHNPQSAVQDAPVRRVRSPRSGLLVRPMRLQNPPLRLGQTISPGFALLKP